MQQFITETKIFYQSGSTPSNANSILFVNTGTTTINIEGLVLTPAQSWSIEGNECEINTKTYYFQFTGVGINALTVIYKKYV